MAAGSPGEGAGREIAVVVDVGRRDRQVEHVAVDEHGGFPRLGQHDELVGEVAADRPGLGAHRDTGQSHAREDAEIGDEHAVVGEPRAGLIHVEGVRVLHQELAAAHHAEARALLVAELPLKMIKVLRQFAVTLDARAEDRGDHLLVGRAIEQLAFVAIGDAQHLGPVGVVAAGFAPEVGELQRRHQQLDGAGAVHLLADDLLDLLQHTEAERQPGVDAGRLLPDHPGAQHEPVREDLRLLRVVAEDRQEEAGQAHGGSGQVAPV